MIYAHKQQARCPISFFACYVPKKESMAADKSPPADSRKNLACSGLAPVIDTKLFAASGFMIATLGSRYPVQNSKLLRCYVSASRRRRYMWRDTIRSSHVIVSRKLFPPHWLADGGEIASHGRCQHSDWNSILSSFSDHQIGPLHLHPYPNYPNKDAYYRPLNIMRQEVQVHGAWRTTRLESLCRNGARPVEVESSICLCKS